MMRQNYGVCRGLLHSEHITTTVDVHTEIHYERVLYLFVTESWKELFLGRSIREAQGSSEKT